MDTVLIEVLKQIIERMPTVALIGLAIVLVSVSAARRLAVAKVPLNVARTIALVNEFRFSILVLAFTLTAVVIAGVSWARHAGYLPYITFEGHVDASNPEDLRGARCLAFRGNATVAEATARVDQSGYFSFDALYNDKYRFLLVNEVSDQTSVMLMSEFNRDLRAPDGNLRDYKFPLKRLRLHHLATLKFNTAEYEVDEAALVQLRALRNSGATPTDLVKVLWFGHADEIGSDESNLRLGLRRALESQRVAGAEGVPLTDLHTYVASFGEDWPAARGSGAQALTDNRRVVVYGLSPLPVAQTEATDVPAAATSEPAVRTQER